MAFGGGVVPSSNDVAVVAVVVVVVLVVLVVVVLVGVVIVVLVVVVLVVVVLVVVVLVVVQNTLRYFVQTSLYSRTSLAAASSNHSLNYG
jgi:hypothetical protein